MLCNALMILEDLDRCDTLNSEVGTYFMNKLRNEIKSILGGKVPTPPNPNAQQVCWSIKLNINGKRKRFTADCRQSPRRFAEDFSLKEAKSQYFQDF